MPAHLHKQNKAILDVLCSVQFAIQPLADRARGRWEQPRVDRLQLLFHNTKQPLLLLLFLLLLLPLLLLLLSRV